MHRVHREQARKTRRKKKENYREIISFHVSPTISFSNNFAATQRVASVYSATLYNTHNPLGISISPLYHRHFTIYLTLKVVERRSGGWPDSHRTRNSGNRWEKVKSLKVERGREIDSFVGREKGRE